MNVAKWLFSWFLSGCVGLGLVGCSTPRTSTVVMGEQNVTKSTFYAGDTFCSVLGLAQVLNQRTNDVYVVGQIGTLVLDGETGIVKMSIPFRSSETLVRPELIRQEKLGRYQLLSRGGGYGTMGVLDLNGQAVWQKPAFTPEGGWVYDMTLGEQSGTGSFYYVAGSEGLTKLDGRGAVVWHQGLSGLGVGFCAHASDPFVLYHVDDPDESRQIAVYDLAGHRLRSFTPPYRLRDFQVLQWNRKSLMAYASGPRLVVTDLNGEVALFHRFMGWLGQQTISSLISVPVRFDPEDDEFLAVCVTFKSGRGPSMLCIFDPEGALIYKEQLPRALGMTTRRYAGEMRETLLVGATSVIWQYAVAPGFRLKARVISSR